MKISFIRILIFMFCITILMFSSSSTMKALYNDAKFDSYENMRDKGGAVKYTVPTLFRQDAPFSNVKTYPLVVQNEIAYVPLEMFFNFSDITVYMVPSGGNFYISNDKAGTYASFEVQSDLVVTHLKRTINLATKIFYSTRYIPAKDICAIVGLNCETYDNPDNGIYALRIYDSKASLSFDELIRMYSPTKVTDIPEQPDITPTPPIKPTPEIPPEPKPTEPTVPIKPVYPERTIYLTFENLPNENTKKILSLLKRYNLTATFFCEGEKMLAYPDIVRQIIAEGHSIGLHSMTHESELLEESPEYFIKDIEETNEVLELLTKRKTRLYRAPEGLKNTLRTDIRWQKEAERNGVCVWDWNINSYDYYSGQNTVNQIYNRVINSILSLSEEQKTKNAIIRFHSEKQTVDALERLLLYFSTIDEYTIKSIDETTPPVNFFGIERLD